MEQIALKKIIDDMSVIETHVFQKLPELLSAESICDLSEDEIRSIASESNASRTERARLTEKLALLKDSLTELSRFEKKKFGPSGQQLIVSLLVTHQECRADIGIIGNMEQNLVEQDLIERSPIE